MHAWLKLPTALIACSFLRCDSRGSQPQENKAGIQMAPKKPLLEKMRSSPAGDWNIKDIEKVCVQYDIKLMPPTNGSHYKASSPALDGHLTIPAKRPIKPFYVKEFVNMIDAHKKATEHGG